MFSLEERANQQLAKLLKTEPKNLANLFARLEFLSGQKQLALGIFNKVEAGVESILRGCRVSERAVPEVYFSLDKCVKEAAEEFQKKLEFSDNQSWQKVIEIVLKERNYPKGFFLKLEKAKELIFNHPPKKVIEFLGYSNVREILEKEDILEILPSLRFIEGSDWLNKEFLPDYKRLNPEDFEEREIMIKVVSDKWKVVDKNFIEKKFHNVTHLKEIGTIFLLPREEYDSSIFFVDLALLFHYLREIEFFNQLLRIFMERDNKNWQKDFVRSISGLIPREQADYSKSSPVFILSRYLEKFDDDAWQIYYPHLNSESLHWIEALEDLISFGKKRRIRDLDIWRKSNWLGKYFLDEQNREILVSFNFIDNLFSLAHKKIEKRYFYHFQESLWSCFFISALGKDYLKKALQRNWLQGYIELTTFLS